MKFNDLQFAKKLLDQFAVLSIAYELSQHLPVFGHSLMRRKGFELPVYHFLDDSKSDRVFISRRVD